MRTTLTTRTFGTLAAAALVLATACKKDEDNTPDTPAPSGNYSLTTSTSGNVVTVSDSTNQDFTFTSDKVWILQGFVKIQGGTLTIEPGTVIKGDKPSKGSLVIQRGAKIHAVGTASSPIVFTSNQPAGARDYGDWGGIILCGRAPNNQGSDVLLEGGTGATFGGSDENDNSGEMQYVRIEFPGIAFQPNNEINGLTFGGVGSGTTIDHIQVSYSGDDSYEFFGGSVNCKYMVAFRGWDDEFDTDNGYSGHVQFGLSLRDPQIADASGSNGFESDNDASGDGMTPITSAVFSNISFYGPLTVDASINSLYKRGAHLRRNTRQSIHNSLIAGYPTGILVDAASTVQNAINGDLKVKNTVVAQWSTAALDTVGASGWDITNWFNTSGGNELSADVNALGINTPVSLMSPDLLPTAGSSLLSGADFTDPNLSNPFFTPVSYKGAFGTEDWTAGWCNWDPQNTVY